MKKRTTWITISSILAVVLILAVAGIVYAAHYAGTVAASENHTATGVLHATETPIPTSTSAQMQSFTIVSAQSTASYSVYEDLILQGKPNNDAIGKTNAVTGSFQIRTGSSPLVAGMNIKIDLRTLQSDSSFRDNHMQTALDTSAYPYATFVSISTQGLPATYTNGQTISFKLIGNLTMHGKTNGETFAVQGKVVGNTITGTATTTIYMTDFGIQPPNLANVAIVQNKVVLTLTFTAQKA